jgi:hypothetical protein
MIRQQTIFRKPVYFNAAKASDPFSKLPLRRFYFYRFEDGARFAKTQSLVEPYGGSVVRGHLQVHFLQTDLSETCGSSRQEHGS